MNFHTFFYFCEKNPKLKYIFYKSIITNNNDNIY